MSKISDMVRDIVAGKRLYAEKIKRLQQRIDHSVNYSESYDTLQLGADEWDLISDVLDVYAKKLLKQADETEAALDAGSEDGDLRSHDEKDILDSCIGLMYGLVEDFKEYLEYIDFKPEFEDELFSVNYTYGQIVQRLFLWNTNHGGGTSTGAKCRLLGKDYSESVRFEIGNEEDEGED